MKKISLFLIGLLLSVNIQAQQAVEMADQFRADGKIYVVVAVATVLLAGILLYVIRLDSKLSRLEKEFGPDAD